MFSRDLKSETTTFSLCDNAAIAATANQTGIDVSDYAGNLMLIANIGVKTAGTNPTMDITIETSDTLGSGYAAPASGAIAFAQATTTASLQVISVETRLVKKYIRAVTTLGGTATPSFPVSVTGTGYKKQV